MNQLDGVAVLFNRSISNSFFVCFLLWHGSLAAATVQVLVSPAWLQSGGERHPLKPGVLLKADDVIETGLGGRVRLVLEEGVLLKLGSDSRLLFQAHDLTLLSGVVRLKVKQKHRDSAVYRLFSQGRPTLSVPQGTEVWLKRTINSWRTCRVKGMLMVEKSPASGFILNRPRHCYEWLADAAQGQFRYLSKARMKTRLQEVNTVKDQGLLIKGGSWVAYLGQFRGRGGERLLLRLQQQGYPVEREMAYFSGEEWQRLMIRGFYEESEALAFVRRHRSWSSKKMWVEEQ
ncbi:MAG: hypothetical protein Q9O24_03075 [Gammaproteobacteria bacterium]|nr:hypothetical protein [Gammaproteobacteria bacterium]